MFHIDSNIYGLAEDMLVPFIACVFPLVATNGLKRKHPLGILHLLPLLI